MKKKLVNIFILLIIYPNSKSNVCENHNKDLSDCKSAAKTNKYHDFCCFLNPINGDKNNSICKTVPYSSYFKDYNKEYINGTLYNVNCSDEVGDEDKTYSLEKCGNNYKDVNGLKDCKKFSTFVDSCCYFSGEKDDFKPGIYDDDRKPSEGCYRSEEHTSELQSR